MKEKIINYIETLEAKSLQVDDYFKQRNELYIENQNKDKEIERLKEELEYTIPIVEHNKTITKHLKEIERLNNIINSMEKFFQYAYDNEVRPLNDRKVSVWTICLEKLQELKGSDKE